LAGVREQQSSQTSSWGEPAIRVTIDHTAVANALATLVRLLEGRADG
jgi:hypothetical protein